VIASLKWLARHQSPDGSWRVSHPCCPGPGNPEFDMGVTGLALLAFLGANYTHLSMDTYEGVVFGDVVRGGFQWMMSRMEPDGRLGGGRRRMYNHAVATLALLEAYGKTGSKRYLEPAQRALDWLLAARNPGRAWRYAPRSGENDSSVSGWAMLALDSAALSGLAVPRDAVDGLRAWYAEATDPESGRTGYSSRAYGKVFIPGQNDAFEAHDTMTALSAISSVLLDRRRPDPRQIERLLGDKPRSEPRAKDAYAWYCGTMAVFLFDGPRSRAWKTWSEALRPVMLSAQHPRAAGCRRGSWEADERWSGEGGRVYVTATNTLALELLYRHANAVGVNRPEGWSR
jgi:hypothetical protein